MDEEVFLLPIVDRRRGAFQQPLLTELGGEVPPVLHRRMAFEGIKMPKQGERRLNLDYVAEGEKSYQKPKIIRGHRSQGDVQEMEEGNDKGRKRKPESGTERFLIQTKTTGWGSAGSVRRVRQLQVVLRRNSVLNPYQKEFLRSQGTWNGARCKNRAEPSPRRGFIYRAGDLGV